MRCSLENKCTSDITAKEIVMLERILSRYKLNIILVEKARSAYKVHSSKGIYCLKKVSNGYSRAKKGFFVSQHLKANGFPFVADYVLTSKRCLFIRNEKATFYLTKWINGREVNFNNLEDIISCSKLLAQFHISTKGFDTQDEIEISNRYNDWEKIYKKCWSDIKSITRRIKDRKKKSEFDKKYLECMKNFEAEFKIANKLISGEEYKRVVKASKDQSLVCHDSYYYQNILKQNNNLYLVDLESCAMDLPMSDLGKYIRRVMPRRKYKWDFDICRKIIEAYDQVRPISKDELYVLLSIIIYPHKYWRLGKKRYIKNKNWSEEKYNKKLNKLIRLDMYKREFIDCFIKFYSLDVRSLSR